MYEYIMGLKSIYLDFEQEREVAGPPEPMKSSDLTSLLHNELVA